MSDSILQEMWAKDLENARKHLRAIGRDPTRLENFVDLIHPDTAKKTLNAAITMLDHPLSDESIETMTPLVAHPDEGIRCQVFSRISITLKEKGTDFYIRCLQEPKFRDKSQPIYRIYRYGNESAVPAVAKRLRQILSTRKAGPHHYHNGETELTQCLDFLHRYRHDKKVLPVLKRSINGKFSRTRKSIGSQTNWSSSIISTSTAGPTACRQLSNSSIAITPCLTPAKPATWRN